MHLQNSIKAALMLSGLLLLSCSSTKRFDPKQAVTDLYRAWNHRQVQVVRDLLADDVQWELMGQTYKGKDEVVQFVAFDDGMSGHVELGEMSAQGDTVNFELRESNEFMTLLGIRQLTHYVRFVFVGGKVQHISGVKPSLGDDQLESAGGRFDSWVQSKHPEALPALYIQEGKPIISKESGSVLVRLAKEWSNSKEGQ